MLKCFIWVDLYKDLTVIFDLKFCYFLLQSIILYRNNFYWKFNYRFWENWVDWRKWISKFHIFYERIRFELYCISLLTEVKWLFILFWFWVPYLKYASIQQICCQSQLTDILFPLLLILVQSHSYWYHLYFKTHIFLSTYLLLWRLFLIYFR